MSQNKVILLQAPLLLRLSFCFCFHFKFASGSHIRLRRRDPRVWAPASPSLQRCLCSLQRSLPLFFFSGPTQLGRSILRRTPEPHWWRQTQNAMVLSFVLLFIFMFCCWSLLTYRVIVLCCLRYFKEHGWPKSTLFETPPTNDEDRAKLIDTLQVFMSFLPFSLVCL